MNFSKHSNFYVHMCTNMRVYAVTSLRGNLSICRSTRFLFQEHEFWQALKFLHAHVHNNARVHSSTPERKLVHMQKYKLSFPWTLILVSTQISMCTCAQTCTCTQWHLREEIFHKQKYKLSFSGTWNLVSTRISVHTCAQTCTCTQ